VVHGGTTAGEKGYWLPSSGNEKSRLGIW
jgi:hypothetical protein